jgi:multidrug resistance protein MdtO
MAALAPPAPLLERRARSVRDFLKTELSTKPGVALTLLRLLIAIVVTFVCAATFRLPFAAISLYSVFIVDRSSPRAAALRGLENCGFITAGVVIALMGVQLFAQFPLLTFCFYALELFIAAFLIRATRMPGPAMNLALAIYSVHNVWERPYPASSHIEQTLWVWLTLCLGFSVSALVEFAFVREKPLAQFYAQLLGRVRALSGFYSSLGEHSSDVQVKYQSVLSYANLSTVGIRQRIVALRNADRAHSIELLGLNTATSLIARLIDVSATIDAECSVSEEDAARFLAMTGELERVAAAFEKQAAVSKSTYKPTLEPARTIPLLPELERTIVLIPTAFSASEPEDAGAEESPDLREPPGIFLPDAFRNTGYRLFALKTMIAALLCYVIYSALDWPGIGTSVVTCLVTALNTGGATKQKQLLRLTGAVLGGAIAISIIVFVLPEIDSITAVTAVVAGVSALCGWVALASPRLSYIGLQTALAFYLALIQDYSATTQLTPARDRAVGVLLGIAMMWLVFDTLWPISAVDHMRIGFARNVRLVAQLMNALDQPDRSAAIAEIRRLRDRIQQGLVAVTVHADSILFEIGDPERKRHLEMREAMLRLQATLRTLFVVEIGICQYRAQVVPGTRPVGIRQAQLLLDNAFAEKLTDIAEAVLESRPARKDGRLNEALEEFERILSPWVSAQGDAWIKTRSLGIGALSRQAARLIDLLADDCLWR